MYEELEGVACIMDDIIVFGKTKEVYNCNLEAMLSRTRKQGLALNPDKCCICVNKVIYFGHKLTANGPGPEPVKVKAIRNMPPPENEAELETIFGTVNYFATFAPNLAEVSAPLRQIFDKTKSSNGT